MPWARFRRLVSRLVYGVIDVIWNRNTIATAVIASGVSVGITQLVDFMKDRAHDKRQLVEAFLGKAREFDTFAARFAYATMDKDKDLAENKQRLVANLIQQSQSLHVISDKLAIPRPELVRTYDQALQDMNAAISQADEVMKMKMFWQRAGTLIEKREALIHDLPS